jgi:hypothetical protein
MINITLPNEIHIFTISRGLSISPNAKYDIIRTKKGIKFCIVYANPRGMSITE